MKVISFLNSKGGVGKTTLATNLARHLYLSLSAKGLEEPRVLLVDADPQGSIRDWQEAGNQMDIDIIAADRKNTLGQLRSVLERNNYHYVLIDTPGRANEITGMAIALSDACIIPVQPSPYDLWASEDIAELILMRQSIADGSPKAYYVLNRCIPNTKISNEVSEYLEGKPFKSLGTVFQRVVYANTAKVGKTIFDSPSEAARDDILQIGNALLSELKDGV